MILSTIANLRPGDEIMMLCSQRVCIIEKMELIFELHNRYTVKITTTDPTTGEPVVMIGEPADFAIPETSGISDADYANSARQAYQSDGEIEIDDEPVVSRVDDGAWVQAWLWVERFDVECDRPSESGLALERTRDGTAEG